MADFLSRLIQRANGQLPGIKPLVRSGSNTFPVVNESATEFEETVTFNDETGPVSRVRQPPVSSVQPPKITGKSDVHETQELVTANEKAEIRLTPDISHDSIRREAQLPPGTARKSEQLVSSGRVISPANKTGETSPDSNARNHDNLSGFLAESQIQSKTEPLIEREIKTVNRQNLVFQRTPAEKATSLENRLVSNGNPQIPPMEITQMRERVTPETVKETQLISPDIRLPERNLIRQLETEKPAERGRPVSSTPQQRLEAESPSVNVRVSIGRVEIKAVQQSEPQIQRRPSVPVGPVISLDAYLKGRDEEGR